MPPHELLGLDVGKARTGIARASSQARLAEPLTSVETAKALKTIEQLAKDNDVQAIAIGLPRNLKGEDTAQTQWIRDWVFKAKKQLMIALYWQDEALTTKIAEAHKLQSPVGDEHALAAAIILQDFLDTPEADRQVC